MKEEEKKTEQEETTRLYHHIGSPPSLLPLPPLILPSLPSLSSLSILSTLGVENSGIVTIEVVEGKEERDKDKEGERIRRNHR